MRALIAVRPACRCTRIPAGRRRCAVRGPRAPRRRPSCLPTACDGLHEVVGDGVAVVVRGQFLAQGARGAGLVAGDDVPADASARQMVQRGHAAREHIGIGVAQIGGDAEAQVAGGVRHRRHQQQRIVHRRLHRLAQRDAGIAFQPVHHAQRVGQEQAVELAALQDAGQLDPVVQVAVVARLVARMRPVAVGDVPDGVHVEGIEPDLLAHVSSPPVPAREGDQVVVQAAQRGAHFLRALIDGDELQQARILGVVRPRDPADGVQRAVLFGVERRFRLDAGHRDEAGR